MSGQKKLNNAIKHIRVVAMPSRKKEVISKDANGNDVRDKNGEIVVEKIQLYNILRLH